MLLKLLAKYSISYYDAEESFYHDWMLSLTALFLDTHYISSNRETGDGRADLLLEPKSKRYPGIIFEFKILRGEKVTFCLPKANAVVSTVLQNGLVKHENSSLMSCSIRNSD